MKGREPLLVLRIMCSDSGVERHAPLPSAQVIDPAKHRIPGEVDSVRYIPTCFLRIGESLMAGFVGASSAAFLKDPVASSCFPILSSERAKL